MAGTMMLLALAMLPCGSIGASLKAEQHLEKDRVVAQALVRSEASMMRSEKESSRLQVSSSGEMLEGPQDNLVKQGTAGFSDEQLEEMASEYCAVDFPLGKPGTAECSEASHLPINRSITCMEAAVRAGATVVRSRFEITTPPWMEKHPPGCFKAHCAESPIGVCYFYNYYGGTIAKGKKLVGTPVCKRPMIVHGAKDTDGPKACPANYKFIDDEISCRQAAACMPYGEGEPFLVGMDVITGLPNASKHREVPRGCFVDYTVTPNVVYYNAPNPMGEGSTLKGQVLCNVSSTVLFTDAEAVTDTVEQATAASNDTDAGS